MMATPRLILDKHPANIKIVIILNCKVSAKKLNYF